MGEVAWSRARASAAGGAGPAPGGWRSRAVHMRQSDAHMGCPSSLACAQQFERTDAAGNDLHAGHVLADVLWSLLNPGASWSLGRP